MLAARPGVSTANLLIRRIEKLHAITPVRDLVWISSIYLVAEICRVWYSRRRVRFPRLRTIYRVAVLVMLFQTGLDLSNAALCALDSERFGLAGHATSTLAISGEQGPQPSQPSQPSKPAHVDDCFCCSACVDAEPIAQPVMVAVVAAAEDDLPLKHVPLLPTFLFHPPQLLS